jgi:hypothetical protein
VITMSKSVVKDGALPLASLDSEGMSKFGVAEQHANKLASRRITHCPTCGEKLAVHGEVLLCPTHGSEPFEHAHE